VKTLPAEAIKISTGKKAEPRIPFGALIERGLVNAGDRLYDPAQRIAATVRADGSIACRDASGSIHKIGAHVQGAEACNGWVFWHVRKGKALIPIDLLRQQMRAEMAAAG
jgi:modification methylase